MNDAQCGDTTCIDQDEAEERNVVHQLVVPVSLPDCHDVRPFQCLCVSRDTGLVPASALLFSVRTLTTVTTPCLDNDCNQYGACPAISKDMLENALIDAVTWQTRKWSSFSKFQVFAWMIINSNRKNLNQSENCHTYAHKLFWNACTWHELEDQTFLWSVNKCARVVTKWTQAWQCTFTTQVTTDNIVMWVTRLSIVDWVYSKTQTLLATLRFQSQPRKRSLMYLWKPNICPPSVGCARSKLFSLTVLQSLKSFLWMLDCAWK